MDDLFLINALLPLYLKLSFYFDRIQEIGAGHGLCIESDEDWAMRGHSIIETRLILSYFVVGSSCICLILISSRMTQPLVT